ncbi:MarR family winged helix-turn-helix transcriptional regulator [Nonomuraea ferruginea]|uniref:MarR family transcriptional regulator n=1 Tax=Nonomuraea ferruginea TaxID=46174 RepID=A0ABT4SQT4_9ACTN|nr:MarR family transcriptional regulator [Nonomuraea ferruginea]MDA0639617.1 MarR family transcriptional regulator [Nonomuraea ferruginea]
MDTPWLDRRQLRAWIRLRAVLELLPGVLDAQLRRDSGLTEFEYYTLAMLSEAPGRTLRMTELAQQTNATLPRLSHVVTRLEDRGLLERVPCPEDRRAINARLTDQGWAKVRQAAPGHVATVRHHIVDVLTDEQLDQVTAISDAILAELDPSRAVAALYTRYDEASDGDDGSPDDAEARRGDGRTDSSQA